MSRRTQHPTPLEVEQALDRLRAEALSVGANAVVGLRITTSTVMAGAAEILAYGTAVVLADEGAP